MPIRNPLLSEGGGGGSLNQEDVFRLLSSLMVTDDGAFMRTDDGGFIFAIAPDPAIAPALQAFVLDALGSLVVTDIGTFMREG